MNNKIKVFENPEFGSVRTVTINGEPWFVAADVCNALDIGNPSQAISRLDDDEKVTLTTNEGHSGKLGGAQMLNVISEAGLYSLILKSRKPEAKVFKRWITHEVIPDIRQYGMYGTSDFLDKALGNPDNWIRMLTEYSAVKKENETLKLKTVEQKEVIESQNNQITLMKPKATYYDLVLQTKNAVNITTIAKDYGLSAVTLNKKLHDYGVQYKQGGTWLLYQQYADMGYTKTKTGVYTNKAGEEYASVHTQWTQKGRMFIYEILKEHGILPKMEEESNVIQFSAM